jgi:CheY-like chemotaxis protein/signal transduction histidine kinase
MTQTTILLIEDNAITRKMLRFALEQDGFAVVDADSAAAALRSLAQHEVGLVLQDLMLPDMNGFELVQRLRALPHGAEVPILAVSGLMSKLEEARVSAVGFDDVVAKPVEPSRLLQIVRAHLPAAGGAPAASEFGEGRRMIVADDDPVQRKLAAFRIAKFGFKVTEAADGLEALELARELRPTAIVSDVLMPRLDGFGLCVELRRDEHLADVPLILVTNSYVESADRALARRAGANDFVLRTPDLSSVIEALRDSLAGARPAPTLVGAPDAELDRERMRRVVNQLERQVTLNARAARRCAFLTAELSVLSGISEALASSDDIDAALQQVLAACLDAGGISVGALYLVEAGRPHVVSFGAASRLPEQALVEFFERTALLDSAESLAVVTIPSSVVDHTHAEALLAKAGVASALIAPLHYRGTTLGALITGSPSAEWATEDRVFFTQAVAGQISQALALAQAFAAKVESERAARAQATVLRSILESMADGVAVADDSGAFIHCNSAAISILRGGPTVSPPETWAEAYGLLHPDRVTPVPASALPLVRAMRGESLDDVELFMRRDGDSGGVWLSMNARPLRDETGASHGGVVVFRDISRDKTARTQLMVSDRMASIGMLAAGVAHEINNPLTAVVANLEVAARDLAHIAIAGSGGADLGDVIEEVADARDATDRVRQIVRDLKIFSRSEDEAHETVDITRVLDSSIRMAWNEIRHRARLVKNYGDVPFVHANESRLGQVFLNLLVNAAQAIPEGQADRNEVRVSAQRDGDCVVVDVADTGHGMPPEVVARLFTPFFTTKPAGVGTGLGLTICQRLITDLGGEISVESAVGRGTVFQVVLPAITSEARPATPAATPIASAGRRGRVLVIDDEPTIGRAVERVLGAEHDVASTTSARDALERIRDGEHYDVILCDLMMPVMTGMDFHAEIQRTAPERADSIVFLTGGAFTSQARAFLDQVSNTRIEKPFDFSNLRALVNDRIA